jgi:hypothetical protein
VSPHPRLGFDNRYPDWVPKTYELHEEYGAKDAESKYSGMPNDENTKAWDELIQRS